jgi:hypothetical protein
VNGTEDNLWLAIFLLHLVLPSYSGVAEEC